MLWDKNLTLALTYTLADPANISVSFYMPATVNEEITVEMLNSLSKYSVVLSKLKTKAAKILYECRIMEQEESTTSPNSLSNQDHSNLVTNRKWTFQSAGGGVQGCGVGAELM